MGFLFCVLVTMLVGLSFWFLTCLFGVVFGVFADSGQVCGGFVLDGLKTVLDTLRHSSQLPPASGLANSIKYHFNWPLIEFDEEYKPLAAWRVLVS